MNGTDSLLQFDRFLSITNLEVVATVFFHPPPLIHFDFIVSEGLQLLDIGDKFHPSLCDWIALCRFLGCSKFHSYQSPFDTETDYEDPIKDNGCTFSITNPPLRQNIRVIERVLSNSFKICGGLIRKIFSARKSVLTPSHE